MIKHASVVALSLWLGCGGAASSSAPPGTTPRAAAGDNDAVAAWNQSCTSDGAPIDIQYRDATNGALVRFTTPGDVASLRERVTEIARFHNREEGQTEMRDLYAIPHSARVEEIEGGVELTLMAGAFNDSEALRRNVQQEVWAMQQSGCSAGHEAL